MCNETQYGVAQGAGRSSGPSSRTSQLAVSHDARICYLELFLDSIVGWSLEAGAWTLHGARSDLRISRLDTATIMY